MGQFSGFAGQVAFSAFYTCRNQKSKEEKSWPESRAPKRHRWGSGQCGADEEALALESGGSEFESGFATHILCIVQESYSAPQFPYLQNKDDSI